MIIRRRLVAGLIQPPPRYRRFINAISSFLTSDVGLGATAATVGAGALEGAALGAGTAALTKGNVGAGALLGGLGGAAYGGYQAYEGNVPSVTTADYSGALSPSGLSTTQAGTPAAAALASEYSQGDAGASIANGQAASGVNGVGGDPASFGGGGVSSDAAANATGAGGGVTKGVPGGVNSTTMALGLLSALASAARPSTCAVEPPANGLTELTVSAFRVSVPVLSTQSTWATPSPASVAQTPFYNSPLNTAVPGRTAVTPSQATLPTGAQPNYWSYGGPEQTYFKGNTLANFGFAQGGALERDWQVAKDGKHVRGPGTGTSDSVPAMLSKGEYILTARDVARIGGGSNERGARILDRNRAALAHTLGEPQFTPQTNAPLGRATRRAA